MSNIIEFPTRSVQNWHTFETALRDILITTEASNDFIDIIVARMAVSFKEHELDLPLNFNLPPEHAEQVAIQMNRLTKALQERTNKLLVSRLMLEIELAKSQGYR